MGICRAASDVVLFHNVVAPYRHALFRELAKRVRLRVVYAALTTRDRDWSGTIPVDYDSLVARSWTVYAFERPLTVCRSLKASLRLERARVVICVLTRSNIIDVIRIGVYCKQIGLPLVLWVGNVDRSLLASPVPSVVDEAMKTATRIALSLAGGFISYSALTDKWLHANSQSKPMVTGTQVLDPPSMRPRMETSGLGTGRQLLFVGKHESRKGLAVLASAMHEFPRQLIESVEFVTIGDGPLLGKVEEMFPAGLRMRCMGHQRGSLLEHYRSADLVVLPSLEDPWGFVTNEAMSMGTPVAASSRCGSMELARRTGWVLNVADVSSVAATMCLALRDCRDADRRQNTILAESTYRPDVAADRIVEFLRGQFAV